MDDRQRQLIKQAYALDEAWHMYHVGKIEAGDLYDRIIEDIDWLDSLPAKERKFVKRIRAIRNWCDRLEAWLRYILWCDI